MMLEVVVIGKVVFIRVDHHPQVQLNLPSGESLRSE